MLSFPGFKCELPLDRDCLLQPVSGGCPCSRGLTFAGYRKIGGMWIKYRYSCPGCGLGELDEEGVCSGCGEKFTTSQCGQIVINFELERGEVA